MENYSRDAIDAPLRCLDHVIQQIAEGSFEPDNTRSGRFVKKPASESSSSATASSSDEDGGEEIEGTDVDADSPVEVVLNERTGVHPLLSDSGECMCGKAFPKAAVRMSAVPSGAQLCSRCF